MGIEHIKIGPCTVTLGGVDLGLTKGGVELVIDLDIEDRPLIGQYAGHDPKIKTINIKASCPLAESNMATLSVAFPWGLLYDGKLTLRDVSGRGMREYAKELVITPISNDYIVTLPMATPIPKYTVRYSINNERIVGVTFQALPTDDGSLIVFG